MAGMFASILSKRLPTPDIVPVRGSSRLPNRLKVLLKPLIPENTPLIVEGDTAQLIKGLT
jgi:hypothetical protein